MEEFLGKRPANLPAADKALVDFIKSAGPEHNAALIKLLYRKLLRQCLIISGGDPDHLVLCKMEPILS